MHFLGIPLSRDEVVWEAIKMLLELVFEPRMGDESYEFGPRRSIRLALRTICKWTGTIWLIEGNIKGYFDNLASTKTRPTLVEFWFIISACSLIPKLNT